MSISKKRTTKKMTPTPTRTPVFFVRPKDAAAVEGMINSMTDGIIKLANAWRLANGLPLLTKD